MKSQFTPQQKEEFETACKPLIDWRIKNLCSHDVIVIDATMSEVLSGMMGFTHFKGEQTHE